MEGIDNVYQLAADMGGAGYIFTGEHDAAVMHNSATINLNTLEFGRQAGARVLLFLLGVHLPGVQPARPRRIPNARKNPPTPRRRIASTAGKSSSASASISPTCAITESRFAWRDSTIFSDRRHLVRRPRESACCALPQSGGDPTAVRSRSGATEQTRSFLYMDECLEGVRRLMESDFAGPVNIGSEEMVTINQLAEIDSIAGKKLSIRHIPGPLGVRGRNSDNRLIRERLGWAPRARCAKDGENLRLDSRRWRRPRVSSRKPIRYGSPPRTVYRFLSCWSIRRRRTQGFAARQGRCHGGHDCDASCRSSTLR